MGIDFIYMILKVIIFLPFILGLIYLSLKFGGAKLQDMQNGRFIKILERIPLSKENSLMVAKIGSKGYVLSSTHGRIEVLMEIDSEDLQKLNNIRSIPQYSSLKEMYEKLKNKKEDK